MDIPSATFSFLSRSLPLNLGGLPLIGPSLLMEIPPNIHNSPLTFPAHLGNPAIVLFVINFDGTKCRLLGFCGSNRTFWEGGAKSRGVPQSRLLSRHSHHFYQFPAFHDSIEAVISEAGLVNKTGDLSLSDLIYKWPLTAMRSRSSGRTYKDVFLTLVCNLSPNTLNR